MEALSFKEKEFLKIKENAKDIILDHQHYLSHKSTTKYDDNRYKIFSDDIIVKTIKKYIIKLNEELKSCATYQNDIVELDADDYLDSHDYITENTRIALDVLHDEYTKEIDVISDYRDNLLKSLELCDNKNELLAILKKECLIDEDNIIIDNKFVQNNFGLGIPKYLLAKL